VSRSGFYDSWRRQDRDPDPAHEEKRAWVQDLAEASDHTSGSRRMAKALRALGYRVGRHPARRLLREAGGWVRYRRRPPKGPLSPHADRGVPSASRACRKLLRTQGIEGRRRRKGDGGDNAVVERFFGSLQSERVHWRSDQTREEARADIVDSITMFYNRRRLHA
jgi:transposase InsO family protein